MKTPRVYVTIKMDAPMAAKLDAYNRRRIVEQVGSSLQKALDREVFIDVGEDAESLDFSTPKVTVRKGRR